MAKLYWNTVNDLLKAVLQLTMESPVLNSFRLVGGTSLSLQLGHRISVDIDLFTDSPYESIDFKAIDKLFRKTFSYVSTNEGLVAMGTSYFLGDVEQRAVKLDLYYTDAFIRPVNEKEGIRLASLEDIIAMKLDIISRGGRKKDFWDLHELLDYYDITAMINFHKERHPYTHEKQLILEKLTDFSIADDDFEPDCLKGKHWELIKLDFVQLSGKIN